MNIKQISIIFAGIISAAALNGSDKDFKFPKCLTSRTGDVVCLTERGNPAFMSTGTMTTRGVYYDFDENGKQKKCRNMDKGLNFVDCTTYHERRTAAHYGPEKYAELSERLKRHNNVK